MRVAEIMADFRNLQYYIAQIQANPPPEDYYLEGYTLLRACVTEAQAILASPYAYGAAEHPQGEPETEKSQLQAYVLPLPAKHDGTPLSVCNMLKRKRPHINQDALRSRYFQISDEFSPELCTRARTCSRKVEG